MKRKANPRTPETEMPSDVSRRKGWKPARHTAGRAKVPARRVTINLDEDILAIFRAEAFVGGPPYQVAINQALRSYLADRERSGAERTTTAILKALDEKPVVLKLRQLLRARAPKGRKSA